MIFLNEAVIHFFVGVGLNLLVVLLFFYYKKRRRLFRFGGDSPLSFGTKQRWVAWYLFAYVFEFLSSFHWGVGPRMYVEIAFSFFQAIFATVGLFIVDRLAMIVLEPEEHWMPEGKIAGKIIPVQAQVVMEPVPSPKEIASSKRSWLRNKLAGFWGRSGESAKEAVQKIHEKIEDLPGVAKKAFADRQERGEAERKAEQERKEKEKKERLEKLNKTLENY